MVKVRYSEGVAIHTDPEFMRRCPRGHRRNVDRGACRRGIERRKQCSPGCRCRRGMQKATGTGPSSQGPWPPCVVFRP